MTMKRQNPYGIKTPTTVEEFRENLKRYYVTIIEDGKDSLVVRGMNIPLEEISSFRDIYILTKSVRFGDGSSPDIIPLMTPVKDIIDYLEETDQLSSSHGYFEDQSNFKLWNNYMEFRKHGRPGWYTLDNQWLREFYIMTLGEFTGYSIVEEEMGRCSV